MSAALCIDIASQLDELPELLPFPTVALKLINTCNDPSSGVRDLCQIVALDACLSLKLLKLSNSTIYGCAGQIKTIEHAAVVLGGKGIRDIAISLGAAEVFQKNKTSVTDNLWRHSQGCATVARILAEHVDGVSPDEAFVAGLIHDVGKLVLISILHENYTLIPKAMSGQPTVEDEVRDYGVTHAELGERCGEEWGLPAETCDAISFHHNPDAAAFDSQLAAVVGAANQLSKIWKIGADSDVSLDVESTLERVNASFSEEMIAGMQERALFDFGDIQSAFGA